MDSLTISSNKLHRVLSIDTRCLHYLFFMNNFDELKQENICYNMSIKNNYHILSTSGWNGYELLDSGNGERLERFGSYMLARPDPQAIWQKQLPDSEWQNADAVFQRTYQDKGNWVLKKHIPKQWLMSWQNLSFSIKLTPFKHTGVFPEQSLQWEFLNSVISHQKQNHQLSAAQTGKQVTDNRIHILNLFGYTGIASLVCAKAGAKVTHVDASKPALTWARENQQASRLDDKPIRWIPDDAVKFVQREVKRGIKYDGIIMDPPIFGHGPTGQTWKFHEHFPQLLETCCRLLSEKPLFILINAYAISSSALMLGNVLRDYTKHLGGTIEVGELALQEKNSDRLLSTGIFARWNK